MEVIINGILTPLEQRHGPVKARAFKNTLTVNSIELTTERTEHTELTEQDITVINQEAQHPTIINDLARSIAPTIFGMDHIKESLILQLCGGVHKTVAGTNIRGDIHELLIGDPGTGKSQLLEFVATILPRSVFASGQSTTKAGLTATAVKDDFGEGRWTLEAGALVLADKGIACIDELDKMNKEDRSSMHEGLEQQHINVHKAGISAKLQTRTTLLAAANPKEGRFDDYGNMLSEINLPSTLLTRFDVIHPIKDTPSRDQDDKLAHNVLENHHEGQIAAASERQLSITEQPDDEKPITFTIRGTTYYTKEFLRMYISYARETIVPQFTQETKDYLRHYYVKVRNQITEERRVPITVRQLEAFIRLSEASAKARLSPTIEQQDVARAIRIVKTYLEGLTGETGFDADVVEVGTKSSTQAKERAVRDAIIRICHATQVTTAPFNDILTLCELPEDELKRLLNDMMRRSIIYHITATHSYGVVNP